jgi:ferritin-like protein
MATGSTGFHESPDKLSQKTCDLHRAIVSLMEELEAIDWYQQRVDAAEDAELKAILAHNRDEEKEHASMLLEWIRRSDPAFDGTLRGYLFSEGSIAGREGELMNRDGAPVPSGSRVSVGSLRGTH